MGSVGRASTSIQLDRRPVPFSHTSLSLPYHFDMLPGSFPRCSSQTSIEGLQFYRAELLCAAWEQGTEMQPAASDRTSPGPRPSRKRTQGVVTKGVLATTHLPLIFPTSLASQMRALQRASPCPKDGYFGLFFKAPKPKSSLKKGAWR